MNIILQTIKFMNEANYRNALVGLPSVWKGITGTLVKDKRAKAKNDSKSKHQMRRIYGAKFYNKGNS